MLIFSLKKEWYEKIRNSRRKKMSFNLWKKFVLDAQSDSFDVVYTGDDFAEGCKIVGEKTAEKYGKGGTMHANPAGMEIAVQHKKYIVGYVGRGNLKYGYIGIVRK